MNTYTELKQSHSAALNAFPMAFAFSNKQLDEALEKLGAKDTSEVVKISGGGLILKTNKKPLVALFLKHEKERSEALKNDEYLKQALTYELANHEYGYTYDIEDTLDAIGIDMEEYQNSDRIKAIAKKAISEYLNSFEG